MNQTKVVLYTREPDALYTSGYANSLHLGILSNENHFQPLNREFGILFAPGYLLEDNTIQALHLTRPAICPTENGFAITALGFKPTDANSKECQRLIVWHTTDFLTFSNPISCVLSLADVPYSLNYETEKDALVIDAVVSPTEAVRISLSQDNHMQQETRPFFLKTEKSNPAIPGTSFATSHITDRQHEEIRKRWSIIENTEVTLAPDISAVEDLSKVQAKLTYSDGSSTFKAIDWAPDSIQNANGTQTFNGIIRQEIYSFPLAVGYADPQIIHWDDYYYFIATNDNVGDIGLFVRKAQTISALFEEGFDEYLILDVDVTHKFIQTFWAPEFHVIGGKLSVLFAVSPEKFGPQCHLMQLRDGGKIEEISDWSLPVNVTKTDGSPLSKLENKGITLDMTYLEFEHKSYYVWSYREFIGTPQDTGSMLMIASVNPANPTILTSEPKVLSRPLLSWENIHGTINNEGPFGLIREDGIHLYYSGGAATSYTYAIGELFLAKGADPLNIAQWKKMPTPVLSYHSVPGEFGPGHHSFFTDVDGQLYIAFHGETQPTGTPRCSMIRKVHYALNNRLAFDVSPVQELAPALRHVSLSI